MTLSIGGALDDARAFWRRDRDLLIRLTAPFLFLPALAAFLLLPQFVSPTGGDATAQQEALIDFYLSIGHWLLLQKAVEIFGTLAVSVRYLDRNHRTVGDVLRLTAGLFPAMLLAAVMVWAILTLGALAFLFPAFYAAGRLALVGPALVAERLTGPGEAITRSVALTRGRGWALFGALAAITLTGLTVTFLVRTIGLIAGGNPVAAAIFDVVAAGIAAATVLARALFAVAFYRRAVTTR